MHHNDVTLRQCTKTGPHRLRARLTSDDHQVSSLAGVDVVVGDYQSHEVGHAARDTHTSRGHRLVTESGELLGTTETDPATAGHDDGGHRHD
jgi:hypothetical protein